MPIGSFFSALGSLGSSMINAWSQESANAKNVALQKEINDWQKHFATNAYQIATRDKMKAGLSPLDSSPAQAPTLTAAHVEAPQFSDLGNAISQGMSNDLSLWRLRNETSLNNAQVANINADTTSKVSDAQFKVASLQDRLDAMKEETKQKKFKTFADKSEWYSRMEELEEQIQNLSAQTTNILHSTANEMSMNPRMQAESISRTNLNNAQAVKTKVETHGAFVDVRQKLNDLVKSERWNIRSSDKLPNIVLSLIAGEDKFVHSDADLVKATVEAAQNYAKYNKMTDSQFIDYLLSELEVVFAYSH